MEKMTRWDLMITPQTKSGIEKLAQARKISAAEVVRVILNRALGIERPKEVPIKFADEPGLDPIKRR